MRRMTGSTMRETTGLPTRHRMDLAFPGKAGRTRLSAAATVVTRGVRPHRHADPRLAGNSATLHRTVRPPPPRNLEVPGDFRTQRRQAVHGRMDHIRRLHGAHTARAKARPDLAGKCIQGGQTHLEWQDRIWAKTDSVDAWIRQRHWARKGCSLLEVRAYNGPRLPARLDISLGGQQGIGGFDSTPRQPQFLR
ncbi:hypothetical protein ABIB94_001092 [Bradyrhizobium sp. JR7.2]